MSFLPISPAGRRYGRFNDNPYHPARKLLALNVPENTPLPPSATTSQWMGSIRDQGQLGSCTGQMGAEIRDLLYRKLYLFEKSKTVSPPDFKTSASFVYKCNLIADGDLGQDAGSTIHQTFITLNQKGACIESQEPYSDADYSNPPLTDQYAEGIVYGGCKYHFLPNLIAMKSCIASGYSFGFGIDVYSSFESAWEKPGFMPMPNVSGEGLLGGHAQHVLDYSDTVEFPDGNVGGLFVQNSWGSDWGISAPGRSDGGCYWLPYAFVNAGLATDAWIAHEGPVWR